MEYILSPRGLWSLSEPSPRVIFLIKIVEVEWKEIVSQKKCNLNQDAD